MGRRKVRGKAGFPYIAICEVAKLAEGVSPGEKGLDLKCASCNMIFKDTLEETCHFS